MSTHNDKLDASSNSVLASSNSVLASSNSVLASSNSVLASSNSVLASSHSDDFLVCDPYTGTCLPSPPPRMEARTSAYW